jgi:alanine racemase
MTSDNFGTWLEIDLQTLCSNFHQLTRTAGVKVMPIVKANAYGHGLERVALELQSAGAEWFGVARVEEALFLREIGIQSHILVLGYTPPARVAHAINNDISLTVYDCNVAKEYVTQARGMQKNVNLHVKIDTGMGRLGIMLDEASDFLKLISQSGCLNLEGVFTHFACADEPDKEITHIQIENFSHVLEEIRKNGIPVPIIHSANSAGAINFPEARFDMVRAGIALYGHPPAHATSLPSGISPAISWKTRLISIKQLPAGYGVSYGHRYHTEKEERIGVIAVGYGDGLRRRSGNQVLIRGKKVDIVGTVCMDQSMVQLDDLPDAQIGDEVVIMGRQNGAEISATDIADQWETINYEIICGLAARMPRYYLNGK